MKQSTLFLLIAFIQCTVHSQLSDLARIEYVGTPDKSSGIGFDKYRALINFPIPLKDGTFFISGLDYSKINVTIDEEKLPFNSKMLEEFQVFELNLGYTYKMNDAWRFAATIAPGFSTNLSQKKLTTKDATLSAGVFFIKTYDEASSYGKPRRLILGISASNNRGFPFLPFVSYFKKFHQKWSFNVGVPKSNIQFYISDRHRLKGVLRLDGFNGFIQDELRFEDGVAERLRVRLILGGLRYEYKITKNIELYINGSYIIDSNIILREGATKDVFEINDKNDFYAKTGIRFKV